jgi:tetratricopeptide (TPR) repeat protein
MKSFTAANAAFLTAMLTIPSAGTNSVDVNVDFSALKARNAITCTPDRSSITKLLEEENDIPLMPGSGSYVWKIDTKSDSAQLYFNQGINMYYGFHIIEAIASFKKAAKFDDANPMVWWAQALAYGPNINDVGYTASPDALSTTKKAVELVANASPVEKSLIEAMAVRYTDDTTKTREGLNQLYVDAMKSAYDKFPNNVDVMTLYADAMMLQHPWDLWAVDGVPKPWQPPIQSLLEKIIKANPMHPGANHYYIHIVEASPTPGKALHSAEVLGKITPGLSHLVHMPSHIYLRTGHFNRGVNINEDAVKTYQQYRSIFPAASANAFIYSWHNLHMLANCAMLAGRYSDAIKAADQLVSELDTASLASPPPMGSFLYYMYMTPMLINLRFEKWDEVMKTPKPDSRYIYANVLYHFGKGMAYARNNKFDDARREATEMETLMKDESLTIPMSPFSAVLEGATVAYETLQGYLAIRSNDTKTALSHFEKAAEREWNMVYTEPRDWMLNPHYYLGTAYLADKNYKKAEQAFKKDLSKNALNVWSLAGLEKALRMQKKNKEAATVKAQLKKASEKADSEVVIK